MDLDQLRSMCLLLNSLNQMQGVGTHLICVEHFRDCKSRLNAFNFVLPQKTRRLELRFLHPTQTHYSGMNV